MMTRGRLVFIGVSLLTVALLATGTMWAANQRAKDDGSDSLYKYLAVFTEVFSLVNRAYVDELDSESLVTGALEGTLDALDPFALLIPPGSLDTYETVNAVGHSHSGMIVLKERGVAYIVTVVPGSPAEDAGLESQQILSAVNGERTRQMSLLDIQALLAGDPGTTLEIERLDQGQKETVELTLGEYPRPAIELRAERGVAVLRLPTIDAETAADVATSLRTLTAENVVLPGLEQTDKLVLDLRGTAGGDPPHAYRIADLFTQGDFGALQRRGESVVAYSGDEAPLWTGEIAVLMDRGTQGPAEVLASILQQSVDASLVGVFSFGHAGRSTLVKLSNGSSLQLTDAFYTGPDLEPIHEGLEPDVKVRPNVFGEEDPTADPILEAGLDHLLDETEDEDEERQAA